MVLLPTACTTRKLPSIKPVIAMMYFLPKDDLKVWMNQVIAAFPLLRWRIKRPAKK